MGTPFKAVGKASTTLRNLKYEGYLQDCSTGTVGSLLLSWSLVMDSASQTPQLSLMRYVTVVPPAYRVSDGGMIVIAGISGRRSHASV